MQGEPIEVELLTVDATSSPALVLREQGSSISRVLEANERVILYNVSIYADPAVIIARVFSDHNNDGTVDENESMVIIFADGSNHQIASEVGMSGAPGVIPKVNSPLPGTIQIVGQGMIVRA